MKTLRALLVRFVGLFRRKHHEAEMNTELRAHVDALIERNLAAGMSPDEARHAARRTFGGVAQIAERARDERRSLRGEQLMQDLRYALRTLRKAPGFTSFALLTLALGIGATTAIFNVVNAVLLRALPVHAPQELVFLSDPDDAGGIRGGIRPGNRDLLTYPEFQNLREHNAVFSGLVAIARRGGNVVVTNPGQPDSHGAAFQAMVSGNYFSVLGVGMSLGRPFTGEIDQVRDAHPVAVISHAFWQSRFGGDPAVIGRVIRINNTAFEIIGVTRPGFSGETVGWPVAVWLPLSMQSKVQPGRDLLSPNADPAGNFRWLNVMGRLKPGVSVPQAQAGVDVAFRQYLEAQLPAVAEARRQRFLEQRVALTEGSRGASTLRKGYAKPLVVLMALVGLLLLSACANLANLTLARAARRQKEIALRVALGAKAARVFRQLMTESLLLSLAGGALGLLLAHWGGPLLLQLVTQNSSPVQTDLRVLLFALGVSLVVGILFGAAPALRAWRVDLNTVLKGAGEGAARARSIPLGKVLVCVQVGLSLPLLVISGLFVHSLQKLGSVDLGYEPDRLLLLQTDTAGYNRATLAEFYRDLSQRIRALPGIRGATFSGNGLFAGRGASYRISIEGYEPPPDKNMSPSFDHVGPGYFSTVGIPVRRGREIGPEDAGGGAQRVGLINETMARDYFGDADPLGRIVTVNVSGGPGAATPYPFVVIGVVADAKYSTVRETARPFYYVPLDNPVGGANAPYVGTPIGIIRTTGNPSAAIAAIRAVVKEAAPNSQPPTITTVNQKIEGTLGLDRALTGFSGFFGVLATILVSIGIYGIMAYAVARRTREIGIRIAIGAQKSNVLHLIIGESLFLILCGAAIGIPAAIAAGKFVAAFLFGLTPMDPLVLGAAVGLMFFVGALAAYFPARSATRVDPMVALRAE